MRVSIVSYSMVALSVLVVVKAQMFPPPDDTFFHPGFRGPMFFSDDDEFDHFEPNQPRVGSWWRSVWASKGRSLSPETMEVLPRMTRKEKNENKNVKKDRQFVNDDNINQELKLNKRSGRGGKKRVHYDKNRRSTPRLRGENRMEPLDFDNRI